ncbi:MAG: retron system putative HNH endonuclease [Desulfococcaceae bacterium]
MRNISKFHEPNSLVEHRCQSDPSFNNLPAAAKKEIRIQLLKEQGYLCCYCMSRISDHDSRIEHWHSQANYPQKQLDYGNLLLACCGNQGNRPEYQYCDVRKGDHEILYNPADPTHNVQDKLRYHGDGMIESNDSIFDKQLNEILNLNFSRLQANRKSVIKGVCIAIDKRGVQVTKGQLRQDIRRWDSTNSNGELKEYCQVAIYFLNKRLKRA